MAKVGVIGGLGTDTAARFYVQLERLWHDGGATGHIPLVLENIQSEFSLEQSAIQGDARIHELLPFLLRAAKNLERSGATCIAIPCNTVHVHIKKIRKAVGVRVLSITEATAQILMIQGVSKAGILGTRVTKNSGIYVSALQPIGIQPIFPTENDQQSIELIIKRALSWTNTPNDQQLLVSIIERMKINGAQSVVLACTDLQLCMPTIFPDGVVDSMQSLAEATVKQLHHDISLEHKRTKESQSIT